MECLSSASNTPTRAVEDAPWVNRTKRCEGHGAGASRRGAIDIGKGRRRVTRRERASAKSSSSFIDRCYSNGVASVIN